MVISYYTVDGQGFIDCWDTAIYDLDGHLESFNSVWIVPGSVS